MAEKVVAPITYVIVFAILIVLTLVTVGVSFLELGDTTLLAGFAVNWHTLLGLTIAVAKASLVLLFFMQAIYSSRLTWVVILAALFWLGVLMTLTLTDYFTRPWLVY